MDANFQEPQNWNDCKSQADLKLAEKNFLEAEQYLMAALKLSRKFEPSDPRTIQTLESLGDINLKQGKNREADVFLRQAVLKRQFSGGADDISLTGSLSKLGDIAFAQGLFAQAEQDYERTMKIFARSLGESHPTVGFAANKLARAYSEQKKYQLADKQYEKALDIATEAFGKEHSTVAEILDRYLNLLYLMAAEDRAEKLKAEYNIQQHSNPSISSRHLGASSRTG